MMASTIVVHDKLIRTDWINRIQQRMENGTLTCVIWLSIGPTGVYAFEGKDAETALGLRAGHPALGA
jgi:hypothetical protein